MRAAASARTRTSAATFSSDCSIGQCRGMPCSAAIKSIASRRASGSARKISAISATRSRTRPPLPTAENVPAAALRADAAEYDFLGTQPLLYVGELQCLDKRPDVPVHHTLAIV